MVNAAARQPALADLFIFQAAMQHLQDSCFWSTVWPLFSAPQHCVI